MEIDVVAASAVVSAIGPVVSLFSGVVFIVSGVGKYVSAVEAEVSGVVFRVPSILVLATVVAPEAEGEGVVATLVEAATVAMVAVTGIVVAAEAAFPVVATDVVLAPKVVESDEGVVASVGVVMASSAGLVALGARFVVPLLMVKVLDSIVEVEIPCVVVAALGEVVVASRDVVTVTEGTVLTLVVAPTPGVVEAAVVTAAGPLATVVVAETVVLTAGGVESTTEDVGFLAVGVVASAGTVVASVVMSSAGGVITSFPGAGATEAWTVVLPTLVNTLGLAVEAEVTGVEVAALATVVPMAEVVTTPMVAVFSCRFEEAVAVVIVPTGSGVEDPAFVATVDMKTVSEVVESVAPAVTSSSEIVVATAVAVSSTDSAILSFTRIVSSGVTSSPPSRVVSPMCVVAVPAELVLVGLGATMVVAPGVTGCDGAGSSAGSSRDFCGSESECCGSAG